MTAPAVLLLPGRQNSGTDHWQSRWELLYRDRRVEQHDWLRPLRGDWSAQLERGVLATSAPVLLAAHSLGCILVAAWAAHSRNTARVRGARGHLNSESGLGDCTEGRALLNDLLKEER